MNLNQWREKKKPTEVVLPSGLAVKLRKVDPQQLVSGGQIPVVLLNEIKQNPGKEISLSNDQLLDDLPTYMGMIDSVVMGAMVEPEVTAKPTETTVGIDELDLGDKMFVLSWAMEDTNALRPFRAESKQPTGLTPDGEQVRETP